MTGHGTGAGLGAVVAFYARHRYAILLCSLLATIAIGPVLRHLDVGDRIVEWFLGISLLVAVMPAFGERRWAVLIVLVLMAVPMRFGAAMLGLRDLSSFGLLSWVVLATIAGASTGSGRCTRPSRAS